MKEGEPGDVKSGFVKGSMGGEERQIVGEGVDGCGRWANPQTNPGALHRVKDLIFPCLFFVSKYSLFLSSDYLFYVCF